METRNDELRQFFISSLTLDSPINTKESLGFMEKFLGKYTELITQVAFPDLSGLVDKKHRAVLNWDGQRVVLGKEASTFSFLEYQLVS